MRRGPGHCGGVLHQAYPASSRATRETFWNLAASGEAKRQELSKLLQSPKLRRHFEQRHPDSIVIPAIEKLSEQDVLTWQKCFPNVTLVLHG